MKKLPREYRNMSKKQLKAQLLHQMQCNTQIVKDNRLLVNTNMVLNKMVEKYKSLLSHSIENL